LLTVIEYLPDLIDDNLHNTSLTMELRIPALKKPGTGIFKTDPESLEKWVKNLPLFNLDNCVSQLEFGLSEINGVEMPPADRFEVLESLTEPVKHITGKLQKKYLGKRLPLNKDELIKSNQGIGMALAMATGYKLLVSALDWEAWDATSLIDAETKVIPMQRAIRYLSESLIGSYQVYSQHREGIWRDLHALYNLAEKHGLQAYQVIDTTLQKPALTSVETAYKQILLLSLAGPYRLRQGEIRQAYNLLARWAPYSRFHAAQEQDIPGLFTCHLASDDPPRYLQLTQRDRLDSEWVILDTSGIMEPVNARLAELRNNPNLRDILPGENTLKRLMLCWGVMPERRFTRRRKKTPVQLVLGLQAIHRLLAEPAPNQAGDMARETPREDFLRDPTFEQPTVIATNHPSKPKATSHASRKSNPFMPRIQYPLSGPYALGTKGKHDDDDDDEQIPSIQSWQMVDVSVGGYCLLWESNDVSSGQVGELVALRTCREDSNDGWKLGVVRWMKFTPERGLMLGVQLLASGVTPVYARLCRDEPPTENKSQGLLLAENRVLKQPPSLLLPSAHFRTGCLSMLSCGGNDEKIILVRELENTGSFAQFHFATVTES
jgi:cyclic-di-GMP-binding protein